MASKLYFLTPFLKVEEELKRVGVLASGLGVDLRVRVDRYFCTNGKSLTEAGSAGAVETIGGGSIGAGISCQQWRQNQYICC
ncbi:hypothetical protein JOY44_21325 [Phormidium sp. CLA17]|nr:hypothetical protein [Leptolyngbya sp. Cla-17]